MHSPQSAGHVAVAQRPATATQVGHVRRKEGRIGCRVQSTRKSLQRLKKRKVWTAMSYIGTRDTTDTAMDLETM